MMASAILSPDQVRELRLRARPGVRGHGVRVLARDVHASYRTVWRAIMGRPPYDYVVGDVGPHPGGRS